MESRKVVHEVLFGVENLKQCKKKLNESTAIIKSCLKKEEIKSKFYETNRRFQLVADDLISGVELDDYTKSQYYTALAELNDEHYSLFLYVKKKEAMIVDKKKIMGIQNNINSSLRINVPSIFKVISNYLSVFFPAFGIIACFYFFASVFFNVDTDDLRAVTLNDIVLVTIVVVILLVIFAVLSVNEYYKARLKERFIRPGTENPFVSRIAIGLSLASILITVFIKVM